MKREEKVESCDKIESTLNPSVGWMVNIVFSVMLHSISMLRFLMRDRVESSSDNVALEFGATAFLFHGMVGALALL